MTGAKEYGKALFLLTEEENNTEAALHDLMLVQDVMREHPNYEKLLDTPALPAEVRLGLIDEAFASIDINVKNLLKILTEKHAVHAWGEVAKTFSALYDEARGILRVKAITAVPMSTKQLETMREKLAKQTGKEILIENTVDPAILGGVTLRYAGIQLDGSVKTRLDTLEKSLKSMVI